MIIYPHHGYGQGNWLGFFFAVGCTMGEEPYASMDDRGSCADSVLVAHS